MKTQKSPFSLFSLAVGAFGIGLTEFVIMGLLPEMAAAMNVNIAQAGYYISAYALGVVIGAPTLTILGRTLPPKKMLLLLMLAFTVFNGLTALAPNSWSLLLLRFLSGLPHGAFFGVAVVVAAKLTQPGKEASAFAVIFSGLTISNIVGVPFGTYIGQITSWRFSFGLVGLVGLLTILCIALWVPKVAHTAPKKLSNEFVIFKNTKLWYIIAIMSIGFGAFFAWFSYIAPVLLDESSVSQATIPFIMALAGIGMTFGNWAGGKLGDNLAPIKAVVTLLISMIFILSLSACFAHLTYLTYLLIFLTGANAMALVAPLQLLLLNNTKESPFLGASLGQAAFNIGNSLGAFFGGIPIAYGMSYITSWWVGVALAFIGLLIVLLLNHVNSKALNSSFSPS